jgi:hypothetical protein
LTTPSYYSLFFISPPLILLLQKHKQKQKKQKTTTNTIAAITTATTTTTTTTTILFPISTSFELSVQARRIPMKVKRTKDQKKLVDLHAGDTRNSRKFKLKVGLI